MGSVLRSFIRVRLGKFRKPLRAKFGLSQDLWMPDLKKLSTIQCESEKVGGFWLPFLANFVESVLETVLDAFGAPIGGLVRFKGLPNELRKEALGCVGVYSVLPL